MCFELGKHLEEYIWLYTRLYFGALLVLVCEVGIGSQLVEKPGWI